MSEPRRRTRGKRTVYLSRLDRERLAAGEIAAPEEALHANDPPEQRPASTGSTAAGPPGLSGHDQDILNERPPHFGKL